MTWILIYTLMGPNSVATRLVEFNGEVACLKAAEVLKQPPWKEFTIAVCIPKGEIGKP